MSADDGDGRQVATWQVSLALAALRLLDPRKWRSLLKPLGLLAALAAYVVGRSARVAPAVGHRRDMRHAAREVMLRQRVAAREAQAGRDAELAATVASTSPAGRNSAPTSHAAGR